MSDEPNVVDKIDTMFATFPNRTEIHPFNNEYSCGLLVTWMEQGTGFGELTISCNKATGEWRVDTETMGPEWCGTMLMRLLGTVIPTEAELAFREEIIRSRRERES